MLALVSAALMVAAAAESAAVAVGENVNLIVCAEPIFKEGPMPLDQLVWHLEGGENPTDEVSLGASFPGNIAGLKFELLEAVVSETGQYKFEIAPTFAIDSPDKPNLPRLDFRARMQRQSITNVAFEFTYARPAKNCTDERHTFHLEAAEALKDQNRGSAAPNAPQ